MATTDEPRTLIDALLWEQRELTAVERFARIDEIHPTAERRYRDLIPLSRPGAGQQFAFEVDLDRCSGCKACVTACHALNGLDDGETWREVESLISDDWRKPFQQTVTSACHHCVDPACMNGCPVLAYEKDAVTGIVRHFDDQCIGCQYCVMMCPYDVPKYSEARGIVRKCDMCSQRLAVGEAPACAQACPNEAITITIVEQAAITAASRTHSSERLPAFPDPAFTLPTTRYISKNPVPADLVPADRPQVASQPAHWPLVFMLVLTQLSAGAFAVVPFLMTEKDTGAAITSMAVLIGLIALFAGLGASIAHLGRPLKAWRSFLGLRKSWLSREVMAFGMFAPLATLVAVALWLDASGWEARVLAGITATIGIAGVVCSSMVYESTPRPLWQKGRSIRRFLGTTMLLGLAAGWMSGSNTCAAFLALTAIVKLAFEHRLIREAWHPHADEAWPRNANFSDWSLVQSAVLLRDRLGLLTRLRFFCGWVGGVILPLVAVSSLQPHILAAPGFLLCLLGELAERYTFFRAVVPPKLSQGSSEP